IATNMHVIGEARPITVQTSDGKRYEATTVHATDRGADLAVIRIDLKDLPALELGDSDEIKQGRDVVSRGNPRGLEYRVAGGVGRGALRQRAGHVLVEGTGTGFGGRSLCLSKRALPKVPYEACVTVKLDDESGAAGLVFHADGGDKHYGFYPSNGQLRFTRFD